MDRPTLRISKHDQDWYWHHEDFGHPPAETGGPYGHWRTAEEAARAAHPEIPPEHVHIHAVRGPGTAYEDSLPPIPWP